MKPTILTASDIARVPSHLAPMEKGGKTRMGCPFHGSDSQRSLEVNKDGVWRCYSCGEWGFTEERDQQFKESSNKQTYKHTKLQSGLKLPRLNLSQAACEPLEAASIETLRRWQQGLDGASAYLQSRAIPMGLAGVYGFGFKPKGEGLWEEEGKPKWWDARVVVSHTNPEGQVVSLYSRSISPEIKKQFTHAHLPLPKGHFNAQAFLADGEPLYVCEGAFDAISLMAVGFTRAIAVFGLSGFRWDWVQPHEREIVLALDQDSAGQKAIPEFLVQAAQRGISVSRVTAEEIGGKKDINEALVAGCLGLKPTQTESQSPPLRLFDPYSLPDSPPEGLNAETWLAYVALCKQQMDTGGYTPEELYSLPTGGLPSDAGVLWRAAGFTYERLIFEPGRVVFDRPNNPLVLHRGTINPSGVLPQQWGLEDGKV